MGNRLKPDLKSRKGDSADKGKPPAGQPEVLAPINFGDLKFRPGIDQDPLAGFATREVRLEVTEQALLLDECEIHVSRSGQAGQHPNVVRFFLDGNFTDFDLALIFVPGNVLANRGRGQIIRLDPSPSGSSARVLVRADATPDRYPLTIFGVRADGSYTQAECVPRALPSAQKPGRADPGVPGISVRQLALTDSTATMIVE
jgi:hypothetical protein